MGANINRIIASFYIKQMVSMYAQSSSTECKLNLNLVHNVNLIEQLNFDIIF